MVTPEKAKRLEAIARLYYERGRTQDEIARELKVSRPLISRLLHEAREAGIVEIRIHSPQEKDTLLLAQAKNLFGLRDATLLSPAGDDSRTNQGLAQAALDYIRAQGGGRVGLGWGHVIGALVRILEAKAPERGVITDICPMVGNSGVSIRYYHSNENVRIVAHHTLASPHYLHTPAFAETRQEMDLLRQTENYKTVSRQWGMLDIALVNIGNHPSSPDFASVARYGKLLAERQAVGRLIAYYYTVDGEIIHSDKDYAIQIPLSSLARSRHVVGLCSANCSPKSLAGALRTGLLTHLIATGDMLDKAMRIADE